MNKTCMFAAPDRGTRPVSRNEPNGLIDEQFSASGFPLAIGMCSGFSTAWSLVELGTCAAGPNMQIYALDQSQFLIQCMATWVLPRILGGLKCHDVIPEAALTSRSCQPPPSPRPVFKHTSFP